MLRSLIAFALFALTVGCGGQKEPAAPGGGIDEGCGSGCGCGCGEEEETSSTTRGDYTPERGTATIKGVARFEGKPPKRRSIDMGTVDYCLNCNPGKVLSESAIIGANGELKNVFVQIKYGLRGWKFPKPEGEVVLDQSKCMYVPHVLGLRVGQKLRVRNSDPIMHNVHALPYKGSKTVFNFAQTQKGQEDVESIRRAGIYVAKCEVHGWMSSYIGVVKHPFFAVTGDDGTFVLNNVPPGEYTIEAWHEKFGVLTRKITVGDEETSELSFVYSKKKS